MILDSFESISPTAILTSYPRIFTDIPYEKEIYKWLEKNCDEEVSLNKLLAPEIEARYKLTNRLLDSFNISQVLEVAAGYCSRGLIYSNKGYNYIEVDLEGITKNKRILLESISKIPSNLHIVTGNALEKSTFDKCKEYLKNDEVAIINEGLFRYLTFEEKKKVAQNIYEILKEYGGVWITCDVTPKRFIKKQDKCLPKFNSNLSGKVERNTLTDRFDDINHIKSFFGEIGFKDIQIHKFIDVKDEITSFDNLEIDRNSFDELLDTAIVAVMKV